MGCFGTVLMLLTLAKGAGPWSGETETSRIQQKAQKRKNAGHGSDDKGYEGMTVSHVRSYRAVKSRSEYPWAA